MSSKTPKQTPFQAHDEKVSYVETVKKGKTVFTQPRNTAQYEKEVDRLCNKKGTTSDDWTVIADADNKVRAEELVANGLPPVCTEQVVIERVPVQILVDSPLHKPIALIYEYKKPTGEWMTHLVQVLYTVGDFGYLRNWLKSEYGSRGAPFTQEVNFNDSDVSADAIFENLVRSRNKEKQVTDRLITAYNSRFLTWSFVEIEHGMTIPTGDSRTWTGDGPIRVPYKRMNGRVDNDVNINLKETTLRANSVSISPVDPKFKTGIIPGLVFDLVGAQMPPEVKAVVFSRSVILCGKGKNCQPGFRVRIVVESSNHKDKCFEHVTKEFIPRWDKHLSKRYGDVVSIAKSIVNIPGYDIAEKKINH